MATWAALATGPSMSQAVADSVRDRCKVVAISDAYRLAPWADALVSQDRAWWRHHPAAIEHVGRKFCHVELPGGVEKLAVLSGCNSGLLALHAVIALGATRVLLLGYDMGGTHFFGPHPEPLRNTKPHRFEAFQEQFARYRPRGVEIINCTAGSALRAYPMGTLDSCLPTR